ncbi:site-specific DNA-methyltransferase [Pyramidobacter piscolens]|uniref:site-specific DNA-methyltransferase n=3 Tax=Pyramidobacter piscolens TaxID=638849 RepID=UPI0028E24956|nr:site-specific DNA-methyltransferase [Pyramidobacter piscolens]
MPNLSQIKRQRRMDFLARIKEEHKDDDAMLIALGEIESELNAKKYGLIWEEHEEAVDVKMRTHIPVFKEDTDKEITAAAGEVYNFLLEGDNLHSLRLLEKTHQGRIDVIYIDPPYNTGGKDFIYNDVFVDKTDTFAHSKWLSFMSERLRIARLLLSDKGSIFISIDDNEQAPLKMLCDEIFGEECFVADIAWQRAYSPRNDSKGISNEKEHILVYSRIEGWSPKKLPRTEKMNSKYKNPDNDVALWRTSDAFAPSAATHQGMVYAIQHPFTGKMIYPYNGACWPLRQSDMLAAMQEWGEYELRDLDDAAERAAVCGIPTDEVRQGVLGIVLVKPIEEARVYAQEVYDRGRWPRFFFTNKGKGGIARKTYLDNTDGRVVTNLWPFDETGHTDEAKKEIKAIFDNQKVFDTPKPIRLLERIIHIASDDDSIVLDFFAGSGTTGHAVMRYNASHEGSHRHFILCTNNEGGICEDVTYRRILNAVNGYGKEPGIPANLKYYRTDFVSKDEEYLSDALMEHIAEMIQLEHGVKLDGQRYIMVLDDEEADELAAHWDEYPDVKALYVSKNVLFTTKQNALFKDVEVHIIPDYYFNFELREVGETW